MKYMMFVATDSDPDAGSESPDDLTTWFADVNGRGKHVTGDRLRPVEDATTVRVRAGELLITDGPFTESREWIAGFDILDCEAWTRLSRSRPSTRWHGSAGLSCGRFGRSRSEPSIVMMRLRRPLPRLLPPSGCASSQD